MGLDPSDQRTTAAGRYKVSLTTTHEDLSQNPLQMILLLVAGALVIFGWRRTQRDLVGYTLVVIATFLGFSLLYKWQVFGSRYLLPFFALGAPIVGVLAERILGRRGLLGLALILALGCLPWLLGITTRPLVARDTAGGVSSILSASKTDLYFANGPYLEKPYTEITDQVKSAGCQRVGLMLSGAQAEYPLWPLLGAPDTGLDIEWIVAGTPSAALEEPGFVPCAVIREADGEFPQILDGLPLVYRYGAFGLYLGRTGQG